MNVVELPAGNEKHSPTRKEWLHDLRERYGEDLRGLSLEELERLPDIKWSPEVYPTSIWQRIVARLGGTAIKHPSEPGFSFDECEDFFDGRSYIRALTRMYGDGLEAMPDSMREQMPIIAGGDLSNPDITSGYLQRPTPAESIDLQRETHVFLSQS